MLVSRCSFYSTISFFGLKCLDVSNLWISNSRTANVVIVDWLEFHFPVLVARKWIFKHTSNLHNQNFEDIGGRRPTLKFQSLGDGCSLGNTWCHVPSCKCSIIWSSIISMFHYFGERKFRKFIGCIKCSFIISRCCWHTDTKHILSGTNFRATGDCF